MKLAQIKALAETASREDIVAALKKAGYERLGSGYFADTYGHPKFANVVKIGKRGKAEQDGYCAFAQAVHEGQYKPTGDVRARSASLPKIYHFKRRSSWFVAVIEKLEGIDRGATEAQRETLRHAAMDATKRQELKDRADAAAVALVADLKAQGWALDMHGGNFLKRGDRLVITDPLSFRG